MQFHDKLVEVLHKQLRLPGRAPQITTSIPLPDFTQPKLSWPKSIADGECPTVFVHPGRNYVLGCDGPNFKTWIADLEKLTCKLCTDQLIQRVHSSFPPHLKQFGLQTEGREAETKGKGKGGTSPIHALAGWCREECGC